MTDFAGLVRSSAQTLPPRLEDEMARSFGDASESYRHQGVLLLQRYGPAHRNTEKATQRTDAQHVAVGDVRLDNREDYRAATGGGREGDLWTAARVIEAYGIDAASRLIGDFAFTIWDPRNRTLHAVRDHFGVRPFYYARIGDVLAFGSDIRVLLSLDPSFQDLDLVRLAQFLESQPPDEESTFYAGIKRLPRGHWAEWADGRLKITCYWSPDDAVTEGGRLTASQQIERFRELLLDAVRCRVAGVEKPGCFLSGGLDSSSVTCVARELLPRGASLRAFSAVFPGIEPPLRKLIDERPYIDAVCELEGIESVRLEGDRLSPIATMELILDIHGQPIDPPNAYLDFAMYRLAADHGVTVALDGLEGDITISHGIHVLDEYAQDNNWPLFFREAKMLESRLGSRRGTVFRQHGLPHLERVRGVRFLEGIGRVALSGGPRNAARALRRRLNASRRVDTGDPADTGLVSHDLRQLLKEQPPESTPVFRTEREAHLAFLRKAYVPSVMEFTHANARHFGVEARHPLFDVRLAQFAVGLDADLKLRDGWPRFVLREAMGGIVPDAVRWRPGKATLAPNFDLRMEAEGPERLESILVSVTPHITDFVKMDVVLGETRRKHFRRVWPALVLALFLKKNL